MQKIVTKSKSSKLKLAAANAAAALALARNPATRYKASIARLDARLKASDDPGEQFELQDQILFVFRMARAEIGVDLGGHPFKSADIIAAWKSSLGYPGMEALTARPVSLGFGPLRSECLDECRYLATATMKPGTRTAAMFEDWRQLARHPTIPAEIAELFVEAGLLPA